MEVRHNGFLRNSTRCSENTRSIASRPCSAHCYPDTMLDGKTRLAKPWTPYTSRTQTGARKATCATPRGPYYPTSSKTMAERSNNPCSHPHTARFDTKHLPRWPPRNLPSRPVQTYSNPGIGRYAVQYAFLITGRHLFRVPSRPSSILDEDLSTLRWHFLRKCPENHKLSTSGPDDLPHPSTKQASRPAPTRGSRP
jgi:hypothetical protein